MDKEMEVMRVLRVPPKGKLVVEFRGQRYEKIADIEAANVQRLMRAAIGELIDFAGGYQQLVDAGVAPPAVAPESKMETVPLAKKREEFISELTAKQKEAAEIAAVKRRRPRILGGGSPPAGEIAPTPLVRQLDQILQKHVAADPDLAEQDIHLIQGPQGGLQIEVDQKIFTKPREIPDKRIQLAIRNALREWEKN